MGLERPQTWPHREGEYQGHRGLALLSAGDEREAGGAQERTQVGS